MTHTTEMRTQLNLIPTHFSLLSVLLYTNIADYANLFYICRGAPPCGEKTNNKKNSLVVMIKTPVSRIRCPFVVVLVGLALLRK